MLKLKVTYTNDAERDNLIKGLKESFKVLQISKEYQGKGKSLYRNIHIDLSN